MKIYFTLLFLVSLLLIMPQLVLSQISPPLPDPAPDRVEEKIDNVQSIVSEIKELAKTIHKSTEIQMTFHGTEYQVGDSVKVFVQLLNTSDNNEPINNVDCFVDVFLSNNTQFLDDAIMTYIPNSDGLYERSISGINQIIGNHPISAKCQISANRTQTLASEFEIINGTVEGGSIVSTYVIDHVFHILKEATPSLPEKYTARYNFTGINTTSATSLRFTIVYESAFGHEVFFFNFTSGQYQTQSPPFLEPQGHPQLTRTYTLTSGFNDYLQNGVFSLQLQNNVSADKAQIEIDFMSVNVSVPLSIPIQYNRNSGEVHVTNFSNEIKEKINNVSNQITAHNQSISNQLSNTNSSLFGKLILLMEEHISINNTLLSVNATLSNQITNVPSLVWSFGTRTLTSFGFLVDLTTSSINSIVNPIVSNITAVPQNVWNFEPRNISLAVNVTNVQNVTTVTNATVTNIEPNVLVDIARAVYEFFFRAGSPATRFEQ